MSAHPPLSPWATDHEGRHALPDGPPDALYERPPKAGTVYLVGAGPGDPGLLTCRGRALIEAADVVLHDALISAAIMAVIPPRTERINVGKRRGKHLVEQHRIGDLLIAQARRERIVVRLKGGDPLVFGRGAEEMAQLRAAGVPYEVVPGVTVAVAGPAMAGIPITHRGLSGAVTFVTGHDAATDRKAVGWHSLAGTDHTLVILMGLKKLPTIAAKLIAAGRDPDTPAAVIQDATLASQRVVTGRLSSIAERVVAAGIRSPATVVVGPVAALHAQLAWKDGP